MASKSTRKPRKSPKALDTKKKAHAADHAWTHAKFYPPRSAGGGRMEMSGPAWPDAQMAAFLILFADLTDMEATEILAAVKRAMKGNV